MGNDIKKSEEVMLTNYEAGDSITCLFKELNYSHYLKAIPGTNPDGHYVCSHIIFFFLVKIESTSLKV